MFRQSFNFFVFLLLFLVLGVATFASSEIRQSRKRGFSPARISADGVTARSVASFSLVSIAIFVITAGLFFFLPRTARAAFQHLVSHRYHLVGFSNHVELGGIGEFKQENVPVMHVKMDRPEDRSLALKWRGAALSEFNRPCLVQSSCARGDSHRQIAEDCCGWTTRRAIATAGPSLMPFT